MAEADRALFFWVNRGWHHPWLDGFFWTMTWLGVGWVQLLLALIVWWIARRQGGRLWAAMYQNAFVPLLAAWLVSGAVVQVLKRIWERPRPSNLVGALVAADERIFSKSFPSGHSCTTAAMAMVLTLVFWKRYPGVALGAWVITLLVMLSRVYRGVHYPSDVLAGALAGAMCGYLAVVWWKRRNAGREAVKHV
ncbi:MAG: phosphatase PAP2 family protein [Armatimonadota bacterium]|nr:phosphatase PAP2 family protein [Armatimonadota bacterium]